MFVKVDEGFQVRDMLDFPCLGIVGIWSVNSIGYGSTDRRVRGINRRPLQRRPLSCTLLAPISLKTTVDTLNPSIGVSSAVLFWRDCDALVGWGDVIRYSTSNQSAA